MEDFRLAIWWSAANKQLPPSAPKSIWNDLSHALVSKHINVGLPRDKSFLSDGFLAQGPDRILLPAFGK